MAKTRRLIAHSSTLTLGLFLVVLGVFLYARQMGYIAPDFPVWPVVLIAFGGIMIAGELSK
jgi:multisubunit Na+/H+ antiporter MnhG subunit